MAGNRRNVATARLAFPSAVYNPLGLKNLEAADVRKEYSRLRAIAQKRVKRLESSEWGDTRYARRLPELPKVRDLSDAQLRARTSDLARWIMSRTSSVSGLNRARREAVATIDERYPKLRGKITVKNWRQFAEFMEYARAVHQGRMYDSERVAEFYTKNEGLDADDLLDEFDQWMKDQANFPGKLKGKNGASAEVWRDAEGA